MKKWRLVITILCLTILLLISSFFGLLKYPKNIFWIAAKPIGAVLQVSFGRVPTFFKNIFEINRILKQNKDLIKENLELQSDLAKLKEVGYENEILKKELSFSQTQESQSELIPVAIIGRTAGYLKNVTVDKGEKHGLAKGMAVVSQGLLVGVVGTVRSDNAEITLMSDYNSLIPVVLQDSRGTGLLRGGLQGLIVEDIPLNITIKENENVVTSGLGGQIPAGLLIGRSQGVISKAGEIFQKISVQSPIDFSKLEVLFVIKN